MSTIRSNNPVNIKIAESTIFTANGSGISVSGNISGSSIYVNNITSLDPIASSSFSVSASYAITASWAITASHATTASYLSTLQSELNSITVFNMFIQ